MKESKITDTRIIREGRIFLLKCAACGATAPLKTL